MIVAASIDWTTVIVAAIAAAGSLISSLAALSVHRQIRIPSGDRLGEVVERTHDMTAANGAMMIEHLNGTTTKEGKHD